MTIDRKTFGLPRRRREGGFTLIEMMVALALSLIVTAAVIALVVAIVRSNRQTLQATRLHQELRATLNLIASDMRRARSVGSASMPSRPRVDGGRGSRGPVALASNRA